MEVKALGAEHHLDAFESWGAQVERFAQEFRIEELNQTLATYPNMVDQIQYQIDAGEDQEIQEGRP